MVRLVYGHIMFMHKRPFFLNCWQSHRMAASFSSHFITRGAKYDQSMEK